MPELPEVETVVRSLRPQLLGRKIRAIRMGPKRLRLPWDAIWNRKLIGNTIQTLDRRGKWIVCALSRSGSYLIIHLGMTGRLLIQPTAAKLEKHTHFRFALDKGQEELRFLDPRRFGSVFFSQAVENTRFAAETDLGPEPVDLKPSEFFEQLSRSRRCLKALLLDQTLVAGIGNIYADEALFEAKLPPTKLGNHLTLPEARTLRGAIIKVLNRAINAKGSTIANFYYGNNQSGGYQKEFRVYDQTDQPCRRCHTPIQRIRLAGRSTHFCPTCQHQPNA